MPLVNSSSKAALGKNIAIELAAGKPRKQAIAIAESVKRKARGYKKDSATGGLVKEPTAIIETSEKTYNNVKKTV